jgi:hypothetical protein
MVQDFQKRRVKRILFNLFRFHNITELKVKKYGFLKLVGSKSNCIEI